MSESSNSLHFWRTNRLQLRECVRVCRAGGRIVASNEDWTCFIPFEDEFFESVALGAARLVLHWAYDEDFGLRLSFFCAGRALGRLSFECSRSEESPLAAASNELSDELSVVGALSGASFQALRDLANEVLAGATSGTDVRDRAADILCLPAYAWLSPLNCIEQSLASFRRAFPDAEDIDEA